MDRAAAVLDLSQPVAVMLLGVLHLISDAEDPQGSRFSTGLDLVEPGLVQVHQWRPDPDDFAPEGTVSAHGAVGRKPDA